MLLRKIRCRLKLEHIETIGEMHINHDVYQWGNNLELLQIEPSENEINEIKQNNITLQHLGTAGVNRENSRAIKRNAACRRKIFEKLTGVRNKQFPLGRENV